MKVDVSFVIPAYNEAKNFERGVLDGVVNYLRSQKYSWEVILVNDGSSDGTKKMLEKFVVSHRNFKLLNISHGGKVSAVAAGVKAALGEIVLFTDFDQSTPIKETEKVLKAFSKGADIVIGERSRKDVDRSSFQRIRSRIFNLFVQLLVLPGIKDSQCGFKAFRNNIGKKLFNELKVTHRTQKGGYMGAFDAELLFLAKIAGYKIVSVPVAWSYVKSNRLKISEPIKMLRDVFLIRLFDYKAKYDHLKNKENRKIGLKQHLLVICLLWVLSIPTMTAAIQPGYFRMHDDLQATRQLVMDKCFKDLQIPCRWSQDLGYGYGYPLFNFYPPLPYYFGQIIHWLGFQFTDTVKVLVVLNFLISGVTMYVLAQSFWGRLGGFVSALFYVYAPYHAIDIYVRAAINEAWALTWFPLVFWSLYKIIATNRWMYILPLSLFSGFLMLSHNPMLMIFAPGAAIWTLFWLAYTKSFVSIPKLILGGIWSFGLAAFFTLPVILEQKYAHVETLVIGYFNYLAHFATVGQLFISRNWGYGDSRFGPIDDISFQVGHLHWMLALLSLLLAIFYFKKMKKISMMIILVFFMTLSYTFMNHQRSSFIWSAIPALQYLQFPWRFLTLSIFGTSFLAGSVCLILQKNDNLLPGITRFKKAFVVFLIVGLILINKDYFTWKDYWPWVTDEVKFSGELWRLQITSGIFDYLPKWAPLPPATPPRGDANFYDGEGIVEKIFKNSIKQEYKVTVQKSGVFQLETFYFPGWRYFVNGTEVQVKPEDDKELGRPRIKLDPGEYIIVAKFTNTTVRNIGNNLSLISWLLLIASLGYLLKLKTKN